MTPPYLGPRASVLLGMLVGSPKTVGELLDLARRGAALEDELDLPCEFGSAFVALRSIDLGGLEVVEALLERLARLGFADRVGDGSGADDVLWTAR